MPNIMLSVEQINCIHTLLQEYPSTTHVKVSLVLDSNKVKVLAKYLDLSNIKEIKELETLDIS